MASQKPWGGRFSSPTEKRVEAFTASLPFDHCLYKHDIMGSIAHCRMLAKSGILSQKESRRIIEGLKKIEREIEKGTFPLQAELEDIHMAIESRLIQLLGQLGGKLHTARSRNDQVALDLRLYLREEIAGILEQLKKLLKSLVKRAERSLDILLPGYTHLQRAQPVVLGHHFMAYYEMFHRDCQRLGEILPRVNVLPLGSAALAGTTLPIDRSVVAQILKFPKISANSLDAVSDRDFILEFLAWASILGVHMSRMSEELITWSTEEFDFIELPDAVCTGSSIMPQKKNPDVLELIRGKSGRLNGNLVALLTTMKGLPLAYNRDMQEDKEPLFDTVKTVHECLEMLNLAVDRMKIHSEKMAAAADSGFLLAADLAEYLAGKGVPFRKAHGIIGRMVKDCLEEGKDLKELSLQQIRKYSQHFEEDTLGLFSSDTSVNKKNCAGGTSPRQVRSAIRKAKRKL